MQYCLLSQNMKYQVIFFTLPPYTCRTPNPAFSILKSNLKENGIQVQVKYVNVSFSQNISQIKDSYDEFNKLIPFLYLLNQLYNDTEKLERLKLNYFFKEGENFLVDKSLSNNLWDELLLKIDFVFEEAITDIDVSSVKLFGFSEKFYQWVPAILLARKLKGKFSNIPIVIGGFGDKSKANLFLKNISYFNYAIWGEGEDSLLKLYTELSKGNEKNLSQVPHLAFKVPGKIEFTSQPPVYLELNNQILPDYSDYFNLKTSINEELIRLPIEASRGCHWCRCNFCYLNQGYKYRRSTNKLLLKSIEYLVTKYECYNISFVDNDLIGLSLEQFDKLLDGLIRLRLKSNNRLAIKVAEIIPFKKDANLIKKMAIAGFENIQIGYEAISDSLLSKMNKKQKLALNIFVLKFCSKYGIKVSGTNIIADSINETPRDIIESIHNLHYQRFLLSISKFQFNVIKLSITKNSRYFREIPERELYKWNKNCLYENIPESLKQINERFILFDFQRNSSNDLWKTFNEALEYYRHNQFSYQLIELESHIYYKEYFNGIEIKCLIFRDIYYWDILRITNSHVLNIDEVCSELLKKHGTVDKEQIIEQINELRNEHIIYSDDNYETIITIIDTDII